MGLSSKSNYEKKTSFLVLTSGKFLEALGSGIGTGSIFCLSCSLSNNVNCDQNNQIVLIELPVRHLFHFLDGPTNGPIGKEVYIRSSLCGSFYICSVSIVVEFCIFVFFLIFSWKKIRSKIIQITFIELWSFISFELRHLNSMKMP